VKCVSFIFHGSEKRARERLRSCTPLSSVGGVMPYNAQNPYSEVGRQCPCCYIQCNYRRFLRLYSFIRAKSFV